MQLGWVKKDKLEMKLFQWHVFTYSLCDVTWQAKSKVITGQLWPEGPDSNIFGALDPINMFYVCMQTDLKLYVFFECLGLYSILHYVVVVEGQYQQCL